MADGWVKVHRQLLRCSTVMKDTDHIAVWIYILLSASHKPMDMSFNGKRIRIQPGQFITGISKIASDLKCNKSKTYRILKRYESEMQIEMQTSPKGVLISVLNWDKYQISETLVETEVKQNRNASETEVNTNKNIRTEEVKNNTKSIKATNKFVPPTLDDVKAYCQERKNNVDPEKWIDFYSSKGWMVGSNKMKDWKAAVRTWERSDKPNKSTSSKPSTKPNSFNSFDNKQDYDMDSLEKILLGG